MMMMLLLMVMAYGDDFNDLVGQLLKSNLSHDEQNLY